jgi:hypothetical protein
VPDVPIAVGDRKHPACAGYLHVVGGSVEAVFATAMRSLIVDARWCPCPRQRSNDWSGRLLGCAEQHRLGARSVLADRVLDER